MRQVRTKAVKAPKRRGSCALVALMAVVLGTALLAGMFPRALAPLDPVASDPYKRLLPPRWAAGGAPEHLLGTDSLGRDLLSRVIYGARPSMMVAVSSVVFSVLVGVPIGLASGLYGGTIDTILMGMADVQQSFPFMLLAIAIVGSLGRGFMNLVLALGVAGWPLYARVVRSESLVVRKQDYVMSAIAAGAGPFRVARAHVLPNVFPSIIVTATASVSRVILAEAALSYLGLGMQPPMMSWGTLIGDGKEYISSAWWLPVFPGIAISLVAIAIALLGDYLRERLGPTLS